MALEAGKPHKGVEQTNLHGFMRDGALIIDFYKLVEENERKLKRTNI